jgi:hypothetical protein
MGELAVAQRILIANACICYRPHLLVLWRSVELSCDGVCVCVCVCDLAANSQSDW